MRRSDKKESLIVLFIFLTVVLGWAWYSNVHSEIIVEKTDQPIAFTENDFSISAPSGIISVGKTTREEALKIYPEGDNLGRSGVYRPKGKDFLMTFSRNEEVLNKMDIVVSDLSTFRGIKVNDSFDKVVEKYGLNYSKAYEKNTPHIYDAMYGNNQQYILFKVQDNSVKKIVIGHSIP